MPRVGPSRRYIPPDALKLADALEERLPLLQADAVLTLPRYASRIALDTYFSEWIDRMERHNRQPLAWIKAYETEPLPHIHAVLVASRPLDCGHAAQAWQELVATRYQEAAVVRPYTFGINGLAYVVKSLGRPSENLEFSRNLSAFSPGSDIQFFGRTSAERRYIRRVMLRWAASGSAGSL